MERFKQKLLQAGIPFRENEPLAAHCTFKIGGPAQLFVQPQTEQQLCSAAALCKEQAVRYYLLGNGSNILFADEGFAGVVIDISALGSDIAVEGNMLTAGAGVRLAALCRAADLKGTVCRKRLILPERDACLQQLLFESFHSG